jgi:hypothetical protein
MVLPTPGSVTFHQSSLQGVVAVQNRRKTLFEPSLTAKFLVVTKLGHLNNLMLYLYILGNILFLKKIKFSKKKSNN